MNGLDIAVALMVAIAAFKGFSRGAIVEIGALAALVLGIWAGMHLSDEVIGILGIDVKGAAISFLITFVLVLIGVHLIAKLLTAMIDIAQLGLPNKLAGVLFGAVRQAFVISVLLNLVIGYSDGSIPPPKMQEGSMAYGPLKAFAPLLMPALGGTKWVGHAVDRVKEEVEEVLEH